MAEIEKNAESIELRAGDEIYYEDQVGNTMFFVKSGKISLFKLKGEGFVEVDTVGANEFFGYMATLTGDQKRFTSAVAVQDSVILNVTGALQKAFDDSPEVSKTLTSFIAKKLRRAYGEIRKLQYFEVLYYDDSKRKKFEKKTTLQTYHVRDIMKFSTILMLAFNRFNFIISKDYLENLVYALLTTVNVKMDTVLRALQDNNIVAIDDKHVDSPVLNLINQDRLEEFNMYMTKNYVKDPNRLLLTEAQLATIEAINTRISQENEATINKFIETRNLNDKSTMEKNLIVDSLLKELNKSNFIFTKESFGEIKNSEYAFESLAEKGILKKFPDETGKMLFAALKKDLLDIEAFQKVIKSVQRNIII